jgi:hypothetical protein
MKSAWGPDLCDMAAWNAAQVEGVDNFDFEEKILIVQNGMCYTLRWMMNMK